VVAFVVRRPSRLGSPRLQPRQGQHSASVLGYGQHKRQAASEHVRVAPRVARQRRLVHHLVDRGFVLLNRPGHSLGLSTCTILANTSSRPFLDSDIDPTSSRRDSTRARPRPRGRPLRALRLLPAPTQARRAPRHPHSGHQGGSAPGRAAEGAWARGVLQRGVRARVRGASLVPLAVSRARKGRS